MMDSTSSLGVALVVMLCLTINVEETASQTNGNAALHNGMYVNSVLTLPLDAAVVDLTRPVSVSVAAATVFLVLLQPLI